MEWTCDYILFWFNLCPLSVHSLKLSEFSKCHSIFMASAHLIYFSGLFVIKRVIPADHFLNHSIISSLRHEVSVADDILQNEALETTPSVVSTVIKTLVGHISGVIIQYYWILCKMKNPVDRAHFRVKVLNWVAIQWSNGLRTQIMWYYVWYCMKYFDELSYELYVYFLKLVSLVNIYNRWKKRIFLTTSGKKQSIFHLCQYDIQGLFTTTPAFTFLNVKFTRTLTSQNIAFFSKRYLV